MSYGAEKTPLGFLITLNTDYYQKILCLAGMFSEHNQPNRKLFNHFKKRTGI